jgi:hypothetical protein
MTTEEFLDLVRRHPREEEWVSQWHRLWEDVAMCWTADVRDPKNEWCAYGTRCPDPSSDNMELEWSIQKN